MKNSRLIIIAHPETGKLFTETKNSEWVKCQLKEEEGQISVSNGVVRLANPRVAFPLIQKTLVDALKLKDGDVFPVEGKIQRKTSFVPFFDGQESVKNPTTNVVTLKDGKEYYQQFEFITDLNAAYDVTITDVENTVEAVKEQSIEAPFKQA